ncbi:hypothetical protein T11_4192 [Trichinella zimbabwensis]|uniref:Uncharacterized protein n=1 Tax=Trichinella zimbabwensis TaxID=268475 RepID=A0A0V1HBU1_9BILA|nr:hypothetical protein T11_4192 [Trichinella zimbabwensis]
MSIVSPGYLTHTPRCSTLVRLGAGLFQLDIRKLLSPREHTSIRMAITFPSSLQMNPERYYDVIVL